MKPRALKRASAYAESLHIDDTASAHDLALASGRLERCEGVVMLGDRLALRPTRDTIRCEVIDPAPAAHRCAEEFKVLVENAAHALAESKLGSRLPRRPLEWLVVADDGGDVVELWPGGSA